MKLWNLAFFEDVVVQDRVVVDVRYAEPFQAIFAAESGRVSETGLLVELAGHYQKLFDPLKSVALKQTG
jgi:hypothetical protein